MILPLEEREEILIVNDNHKLMNKLRDDIKKKFDKIWILLYYNSNSKKYGIEVCNVWGGRLSNDRLDSIKFYIENFMLENYTKFNN